MCSAASGSLPVDIATSGTAASGASTSGTAATTHAFWGSFACALFFFERCVWIKEKGEVSVLANH